MEDSKFGKESQNEENDKIAKNDKSGMNGKSCNNGNNGNNGENGNSYSDDDLDEEIFDRLPMMDQELPPIVRELVSNAPEKFRMPTFIACMAPLGCLATRLRFNYPYDQDPTAPLLQVIICGEQSGGKSFARTVESVIMARQKERDNEQRRLEQMYDELCRVANGHKKKPTPPKTVVICCPVNISIAKLMHRADAPVRFFGTPLTLWTFSEELATAVECSRRTASELKTIMRTAYDLGSEYGVDRLGRSSYSATVDILYNTMFCTTPSVLNDYMDNDAIEGGNVSRIIVCDLNNQIGDDAPVFRKITPAQKELIDKFVKRLMDDTYDIDGSIRPEKFIDMSWLDNDVRRWCNAYKKESTKRASNALDTFYKRSSKNAQRIAALCYYLYCLEDEMQGDGNGKGSSNQRARSLARRIYYFMAEQILNTMMEKWGTRYEMLKKSKKTEEGAPKFSLYDTLPDTFTRQQINENIKLLGLSSHNWDFLSKWKRFGIVEKIGHNTFRKIGSGVFEKPQP